MLTDNIQNLIGNTPLIKLRDSNIYAKLECFNPLGSVKDRAALNMILEAEKAGILKKGGYIIIDDAYGHDESNPEYPTREQWLAIFGRTGVRLIDEKVITEEELVSVNDEQQAHIVKRANELKEKLPEKADLFESYIRSQRAECDELENEISGVTMLLKVIG